MTAIEFPEDCARCGATVDATSMINVQGNRGKAQFNEQWCLSCFYGQKAPELSKAEQKRIAERTNDPAHQAAMGGFGVR